MLTYADMIVHLYTQINAARGGTLEGKVRTAVLSAWGRLFTMHKWAYFHKSGSIVIAAAQTEGTVDVDVSARTVTLTGSTWPTNVTDCQIRLGNDWFPIWKRTSSTVIELYVGRTPPEDLDDATYVLQQIMYPLPADVGDIVQVFEGGTNLALNRLTLTEVHCVQEGYNWAPNVPKSYALCGDSANPNRWSLWVPTQLSSPTNLSYFYVARRPMDILTEINTGTVSVEGGVATFSDEVVTDKWAGAVLRIGLDDQQVPSGPYGAMPNASLIFNEAGYETKVVEVLDATSVRISNTSIDLTDVAYVASAHIDVSGGAMQTLMQRLVEDEYSLRIVGGHTEAMVSKSRMATALNDAIVEDGRHTRDKGALSQWYNLRLADLAVVRPS